MTPRLLSGPPTSAGSETLVAHRARFGAIPRQSDRVGTTQVLEAAGLLGRGGAGFPVGRKWASVAGRSDGDAVVLVNGAEGEPLSAKDRVLMAARPHLVLDGAELAADAVGARRIILYVGADHGHAIAALDRAVEERRVMRGRGEWIPVEIVEPPRSYIAGEESAAVHFVNEGDARPTSTPPRPFERGVDGLPTLVQNVESLAHAALIARYGDRWYREAGRGETRGTALLTVGGARRSGVVEVDVGTTIAEVAAMAEIPTTGGPVLLGGYFGGWVAGTDAWHAPLDPVGLRRAWRAIGCGVVSFLDERSCGVRVTAQILDFMAGSSAAQCGPCVFGLRAIADALARLAFGRAHDDDLRRVVGWSETLAGRGACRHPDGAVGLVRSALRVFDAEFARHQRNRRCITSASGSSAA
jgi:NADH:ubiquinone oxidoreductase subunit F (NADH-binding)